MRFSLKITLLLFFLVCNTLLYSQNSKENVFIKEKLAILQKSNNDSVKSVLYNQLSEKSGILKKSIYQQKFADSALYYANKSKIATLYIRSITSKINAAIVQQDTTTVYQFFSEGLKFVKEKKISNLNNDFLKFKIREIYYNIRQGKISSEEGLLQFKNIYEKIKLTNKYEIISEVAGRISLLHRNRKELGKALNYNRIELDFAEKSDNKQEIAAAKITELDISYQLIPRPIKSEDVLSLINKAKEAATFMETHQILDILPFAQLYLAKFYIHETNYKKGEEILKLISDSSSVRIVFSKYEQLCEIAKSTNNLNSYRAYTLKFKPVAYKTKRPFVALNVHNYLVDYFTKSAQKDSAVFYANKLEKNLQKVDTTQFLDYLYFSYDALSNHYIDIDKNKSLQYKTYANNITQQIIANQKEAFVNIIKYREEVENLQDKNADLTSTMAIVKNNLFSIIALSVVLLAFVLYYFKAYRKSDKKSKIIEEEKEEIIKKIERKNIILSNKQKIYLEDIMYVKSDRNYVEFYYLDKKMIDRNHLKNVLEQLPPNFVKIHRSYIVNKNYIKVINSGFVVLENKIEIPVSRTFKSNLKT
ncbi:MAG: LytR/AlgR family response regulator transcription factor [Polaribacter sp.]